MMQIDQIPTIEADNVDDLVVRAIEHVFQQGEQVAVTAGKATQAFSVNYLLTDSLNRLHHLRAPDSIRYFSKEIAAYFSGSLNVHNGLGAASRMWNRLADDTGQVCSNYGHYVFHRKYNGLTQYAWVIENLQNRPSSRKALINLNLPEHKDIASRDFPCNVALQFLVRDGHVCCEAYSRSIDVVWGLPFDIGFFSLLTELVWADLRQRGHSSFKLGYTMIKCSFTQVYDKTRPTADDMKRRWPTQTFGDTMPRIDDPDLLLGDIYNRSCNSTLMQWVQSHVSK